MPIQFIDKSQCPIPITDGKYEDGPILQPTKHPLFQYFYIVDVAFCDGFIYASTLDFLNHPKIIVYSVLMVILDYA